MDESFGAVLRSARSAAGMSLAELAGRVHYSKGYLSRIENGRRPANVALARRCDVVLGLGGRLSDLVVAEESGRELPLVNRREVLRTGASLLGVGVGIRAARAAAEQDGADREFLAMLGRLRRQGWTRPPALVLPTLTAQARTAITLARLAPARRRTDLLLAASRLAEYAGWMCQEDDDLAAAEEWTAQAVEWSAEAGDPTMARYALIRRANMALHRGDGAATVQFARMAVEGRQVSPRVAGLAAQREAQGHAVLGDQDRMVRCLDRGRELLAGIGSPVPALTLGTSSVPDPGELIRGWCLYDLGRPDAAADLLADRLGTVPTAARRTRARFGARLALAHAGAGDVEAACRTTAAALADARFVDSATIRTDLRALSRVLARWHRVPEVREVAPRLSAALSG